MAGQPDADAASVARRGAESTAKRGQKRRLGSSDQACRLRRAEPQDHVWCWDFVFDRTTAGQSALKWLSIVDEHTRECLALKVDRGITADGVN